MTQTFEDLFNFVLENKGNKCFRNIQPLNIASILKRGLDENSLWFKEENDKIVGMVVADIDHIRMHIFVKHNLAMSLKNLKEFAAKVKKEYPNYYMHWNKNDRHKTWDNSKFYKKLGIL